MYINQLTSISLLASGIYFGTTGIQQIRKDNTTNEKIKGIVKVLFGCANIFLAAIILKSQETKPKPETPVITNKKLIDAMAEKMLIGSEEKLANGPTTYRTPMTYNYIRDLVKDIDISKGDRYDSSYLVGICAVQKLIDDKKVVAWASLRGGYNLILDQENYNILLNMPSQEKSLHGWDKKFFAAGDMKEHWGNLAGISNPEEINCKEFANSPIGQYTY